MTKPRGGVTISETVKMEDYLSRLDFLMRGNAVSSALNAAGKVVVKAAKQNLDSHRSERTGTGEKQSVKAKAARAKRKPIADSIATIVRRYRDGLLFAAIVGARKPYQTHGHLLEDGHVGHFWRKKGTIGPTRLGVVQAKRWLAPAVDSTRSQQDAAVIKSLENSIARVK